MSNHEIKWNKGRHDDKIQQNDEEQSRAKAMKIFQKHYHAWRQRFRDKKGMTIQQIKDNLLELRTTVVKEATGAGLGPWAEFSCKLIDEKLLEVDTTLIMARNRIVQYIPRLPGVAEVIKSDLPTPLQTEEQSRGAVEAFFQTEEEFKAVPFVKSVMEKPGFMGFTLEGPKLMAMFDDQEVVPIGIVSNGMGLERIPSLEDFAAALSATKAADASSQPTTDPSNLSSN